MNREIAEFSHFNLGNAIIIHNDYAIGSEHDFETFAEFFLYLLNEKEKSYETAENIFFEFSKECLTTDIEELEQKIITYLKDTFVILPIYLYEKGGVFLNTSPFTYSKEDENRKGYIYAYHEDIEKVFDYIDIGYAKSILEEEIQDYSYFINSDGDSGYPIYLF